jgi:hypothetical protein
MLDEGKELIMKPFNNVVLALSLAAFAPAQQAVPKQNTTAGGGTAIVYAEGGAFLVEAPKGWITDRETGRRLGICCVWYPEGSTWDDAETVMYPNIATKRPGQETLNKFMDSDLADFREHNPELTYEVGDDIPLRDNRIAKLRFFHNVNHDASEAVAYIDEEKIIAFIVMSSKTQKGLDESIPVLRQILQSYAFVHMHFVDGAQPKSPDSSKLPKD